ncbi:MAG TPA: hypothetical protein VGM54_02955 [Chthoniobacter sp.]
MTPFQRVQPNVQEAQMFREALLAQPPEFFQAYFGFVPDLLQKIFLVEKLIGSMAAPKMYLNDLYRVQVRDVAPFVQLDITRRDGDICSNWRHFQQIKNELVGPECEAVELFPAESRLVDTANQYHLWVMPNTRYRFPFGYENRLVLDSPVPISPKAVQQGADRGDPAVPLRPELAPGMGCR